MVLVCMSIGAVFAQAKPAETKPAGGEKAAEETTAASKSGAKNAIALDVFQLTKGFIISDSDNDFRVFITSSSYERLIASNFSLGADLDFYYYGFSGASGYYFSLAAEGRYYPLSENFEKLFLGTTLGVNMLSLDGSTKPEEGGFTGLITSLKAGYKVITAKNIYLEPSLAYVLSKSSLVSELFGFSMGTPLGWNGGLRIGYAF